MTAGVTGKATQGIGVVPCCSTIPALLSLFPSLSRPLHSPCALLSSAGQVSDRGPSGEASEEDYEAVGRVLSGEGDAAPGQPRSMWQLALERERVGPSR